MRIRAGYTSQNDLARAVGISVQTISAYEKGERRPDAETLYNLAEKLNCTADYLLFRENGATHDVAYIVEYTGLSERAINNLNSLAHPLHIRLENGDTATLQPDYNALDFLNYIIGEDEEASIHSIVQLINSAIFYYAESMEMPEDVRGGNIRDQDIKQFGLSAAKAKLLGLVLLPPDVAISHCESEAASRFRELVSNFVKDRGAGMHEVILLSKKMALEEIESIINKAEASDPIGQH